MNQKGISSMVTIMAIAFFGIAASGVMPMLTNNLNNTITHRNTVAAQYAAESGVKAAISYISRNNAVPAWNNTTVQMTNSDSNETYTVRITPTTSGNTTSYAIESKGEAKGLNGSAGVAQRTVATTVTITTGGGSGDIPSGDIGLFTKYVVFSNGDITNISNTPTIIGDIGCNGNIAANSSSVLVQGTAYTPSVPSGWKTAWNKNAITGGYVYANPAGTLDVSSLFPTWPSITASGTDLAGISGGSTLLSGSYYSNGSYNMSGTSKSLNVADGQTVTIYINGDLTLGGGSKIGAASLIGGDNITIYATGNVYLTQSSMIQTAKKLKIYAGGTFTSEMTSQINSNDVMIYSKGGGEFRNNGSINNILPYTSGVARIYTGGYTEFTNYFTIGCNGLVVTTNSFNLNSNGTEANTIFVSGSGQSGISNDEQIAGFYTNGTLNINSSPKINASNQLSSVLTAIGGSSKGTVTVGAWTVK